MGVGQRIAGFIESKKHYIAPAAVILFSLVLFQFAYIFQQEFSRVMSIATYLTWHNLFEFSSILICFAAFFVGYYTYDQTNRLRILLISGVFLLMGLIDGFHTLSFKGMPSFFIENNSANRATTFWIMSRLLGGVGYVAASLIPVDKKSSINKKIFMICPVLISVALLIIVTYFPDLITPMYIEGKGLTQAKVNMEYIIIALLILTTAKYIHEYTGTRDFLTLSFACALIFNIFSELAFVRYSIVYDIYNYLGHIYKAIAFFIIFRVIFIRNVQRPYIELYAAKNELKNYAEGLDELVETRTQEIKLINRKLLNDLEYARDIQEAMLPSRLPQEQEVAFDAKYFPAEHVSGDFYNVFRLDEHNIGMYIGDVSGHGVSAAMLTVFINQNIKVLKELEENKFEIISPAAVIKRIYESFNKTNFNEDVYVVMLYAIYNIKTMELTYTSAGINVPPIIISSSGEIKEIEVRGFPICKFMEFYNAEYVDTRIRLNSGDKVLFHTDGLTEAENYNREYFSDTRLKEILSTFGSQPCTDLSQSIAQRVFAFIGDRKIKDDITYLIMQVN